MSSSLLFSITTRAVRSFVMLAGAKGRWMFWPNITAPESLSMTMPASAMIPVSEGHSGRAKALKLAAALIAAARIKQVILFIFRFILFPLTRDCCRKWAYYQNSLPFSALIVNQSRYISGRFNRESLGECDL